MADIDEKSDDAAIGRVLRAVGDREQPSSDMASEIRAAVHGEWRTIVAQRARTRRRIALAAAASVAIAVFGLLSLRTNTDAPAAMMGSVSRVAGTVTSRPSSVLPRAWQPVAAKRALYAGETLRTGAQGRAAMMLADGISLRLDHDTRVVLADAEHIELLSGAVYVDAGLDTGASRPLHIDTPAGAVRHLGTQYEIRLSRGATLIRVREGRVQLSGSGSMEQLHAGEQLTVLANGSRQRAAIDLSGELWSWMSEIAPPFDIEGRSLQEFLGWAGRETGLEIVFADAASQAEAASVVLHGSTSGLRPGEALNAVLPTTRLRGIRRDGRILIELQ